MKQEKDLTVPKPAKPLQNKEQETNSEKERVSMEQVSKEDLEKVSAYLEKEKKAKQKKFKDAKKRLEAKALANLFENDDYFLKGITTAKQKEAKEAQKAWFEQERTFLGTLKEVYKNFDSPFVEDTKFVEGLKACKIYKELKTFASNKEKDNFVNCLITFFHEGIDKMFVRKATNPQTKKVEYINGFPSFKKDEKTKEYIYDEKGELIKEFAPQIIWSIRVFLKFINADTEIKDLKEQTRILQDSEKDNG